MRPAAFAACDVYRYNPVFSYSIICGAITLTVRLATGNLVSQSGAVNQRRGRGLGKLLR